MPSCDTVCTDLRQLQDLVRNKVETLLGLVRKLPDVSVEQRVSFMEAILSLKSDINLALLDLEKCCRPEE